MRKVFPSLMLPFYMGSFLPCLEMKLALERCSRASRSWQAVPLGTEEPCGKPAGLWRAKLGVRAAEECAEASVAHTGPMQQPVPTGFPKQFPETCPADLSPKARGDLLLFYPS